MVHLHLEACTKQVAPTETPHYLGLLMLGLGSSYEAGNRPLDKLSTALPLLGFEEQGPVWTQPI